ncbi:MAG TPA: hypothetical protein VM261_38930 [Kofleriaceae bacterium]|nr:hypothetical protein [Kofleriaceae bacterium]
MARLGEILVQQQLITEVQLHEGLQTQVLYGARLGTNLVELGYLTLDQLAKALARRHRVPAALGNHFDRCDPALQQRLPAHIAGKWRAVPIGRLAQDQSRIAVAVRDPLPEHGRGELAFQLDVEPEELVFAVAPELRIHYHLELAYQIPRANRFMRVPGARVPTEVPVVPDSVEDTNLEGWSFRAGKGEKPSTLVRASGHVVVETEKVPVLPREPPPMPSLPAQAAAADSARVDDLELGLGSDPSLKLDSQVGLKPHGVGVTPQQGAERRHFVPTLGDTSTQSTLARIAVRQVASESGIRPIIEFPQPRPSSVDDLARAVRRAETRDRVGELIVDALAELPGAPLDAAAIFVVRPPLAVGWKGFCDDGRAVIDSLAVPLDQPGILARSYGEKETLVLEPRAATVIDERMWSLFGGLTPRYVLVAPICVGDHVVCMLYAQSSAGLGQAEALAITLAEAASTAFGRLLRAAQR